MGRTEFERLAAVSYALTSLQLLYAVSTGLPLLTDGNSRVKGFRKWFCMEAPKLSDNEVPPSTYAVTLHSCPEEVWAPELVMSMSHVARMSTVTAREPERVKALELAKVRQMDGADPWTRASLATWARLITVRALLSSCFAIEKSLTGRNDVSMASISLSLNFARLVLTLAVRDIVADLWPHLDDAKLTEEDKQWQAEGHMEVNRSSLRGHVLCTCVLGVSAFLMSWWMGYAVLKTIMGFRCDCGLWNFAWPLLEGCLYESPEARARETCMA